jgi:hypothetical protein
MLGCDWIRPTLRGTVEGKGEERKKKKGRVGNKEEGKSSWMFKKEGSGELQVYAVK